MTGRWSRIVIHADLDAFYASVEQLDNPNLRGRPVLIGPRSHRGVVLTASYEARAFGIHSAMPMAEARRRCPDAHIVSPRIARYQKLSEMMMAVFADFSGHVETISLDEAFLDMSGAEHFFGPPEAMGRQLKAAVFARTALKISVGISGTKYVAKVASAHQKPDGLTVVHPDEAKQWLAPLPVDRLWGVGKKTAPRFKQIGIKTIGELAAFDRPSIVAKLGNAGETFRQLALGHDPRRVKRRRSARSMGSDRTLPQDTADPTEIRRHLRRSAERISRRLRRKRLCAGGIRIRLKTTDFMLITRQLRLQTPADTADIFCSAADQLLTELNSQARFRLIGMTAYDLSTVDSPTQLQLFGDSNASQLERALDQLNQKFGRDVMFRGTDMQSPDMISSNGANLDFVSDLEIDDEPWAENKT